MRPLRLFGAIETMQKDMCMKGRNACPKILRSQILHSECAWHVRFRLSYGFIYTQKLQEQSRKSCIHPVATKPLYSRPIKIGNLNPRPLSKLESAPLWSEKCSVVVATCIYKKTNLTMQQIKKRHTLWWFHKWYCIHLDIYTPRFLQMILFGSVT